MSDIYFRDCGEYAIQNLTEEYMPPFMAFFAEHLSPENLLARNKDFIEKQFYNDDLEVYNFLVAVDKTDNAVIGAMGFVDTVFYDKAAKENFVWLTNWLASKTKRRTAGLHLLYSVFDYKKGAVFGTVGNNDISGFIYKQLGFASGRLEQYYVVNHTKTIYTLLRGYTGAKTAYCSEYILSGYHERDFDNIKQGFPCKSKTYIQNKYVKNPFYQYDIYTIKNKETAIGVLVVKTDTYNNTNALRIVDFVGEPESLSHIGGALQKLLKEKNAEYIDFYCYGIDGELLSKSGFIRNNMDSGLIVPCYFEPFCQINVPIQFCCQTDRPITIFKGDGDRDFPRILNTR